MSNIKEKTIQQLMEQLGECNKKYEEAKETGNEDLRKEMFNMRFELVYAIVALLYHEED